MEQIYTDKRKYFLMVSFYFAFFCLFCRFKCMFVAEKQLKIWSKEVKVYFKAESIFLYDSTTYWLKFILLESLTDFLSLYGFSSRFINLE